MYPFKSDYYICLEFLVRQMTKVGYTQQQIREKIIEIIQSDAFQSQLQYTMRYWAEHSPWFLQSLLGGWF